jgi:hypothetical protein
VNNSYRTWTVVPVTETATATKMPKFAMQSWQIMHMGFAIIMFLLHRGNINIDIQIQAALSVCI